MSIAKIRNSVEGHVGEFDLGIGNEDLGVFVIDLRAGFIALFLGELEAIEDFVLDLTNAFDFGASHYFFSVSMFEKSPRRPTFVVL